MHADPDIWRAGSASPYVGQVWRSRSWIESSQSQDEKLFVEFFSVKVVGATSIDGYLVVVIIIIM